MPSCRPPPVWAGTRRATSSPRRVMTTSSPAVTSSSRRERFVLASCTPTDLVMRLSLLRRDPGWSDVEDDGRPPALLAALQREPVVRGRLHQVGRVALASNHDRCQSVFAELQRLETLRY